MTIKFPGLLPVGLGRDHRCLSDGGERFDDAGVGVERLIGDQHAGRHVGQEFIGTDEIVSLAASQVKIEWIAEGIHQRVDLGAQSPARSSDGLVLAVFFGRRHCVDEPARWCCRSSRIHCPYPWQVVGKPAPDASFSPPAEAAVDVFPVAEAFRQVPPWHARPVTIQDRLDKQPIVGRGDTDGAWLARQIVLDPIPLVIAEGVSAPVSS